MLVFCVLSFCLWSWVRKSRDSHPRSWTRKGRNDVHFPEYPHDCKQSLALFWSSDSFLSAFSRILVVELDLAEMACVSRNIRRTLHVPSGVPVQRSISERSVSYPSCFANLPPQRLSSLSFRGCRWFVVRYLLSRLLAMWSRYDVSFYLSQYRWSLR